MTSSIHHRTLSARFSAAAPTYAEASPLQDAIGQQVIRLVPSHCAPESLLDAGCGSGRLLRLARRRWPGARLTGVDIATGMIAEARRACGGDPLMTFHVGDVSVFESESPFDVVISSSALHWIRPFGEGLAHLVSLLRVGGYLAMSVMLDGTLRELHEARRKVVPHKVPHGRLPTWDELKKAAAHVTGTRISHIEQVTIQSEYPSAVALLQQLHAMGVTGGDVSQGASPLTRRELRALTHWYDRQYASRAGVQATFQAGYLLMERMDR